MSEIRPANNRPEIQRPQADQAVKTERQIQPAPQQREAQKAEIKQELVRQYAPKSDKPKGGNVDITV